MNPLILHHGLIHCREDPPCDCCKGSGELCAVAGLLAATPALLAAESARVILLGTGTPVPIPRLRVRRWPWW